MVRTLLEVEEGIPHCLFWFSPALYSVPAEVTT
jgi:hypothetical protein